MITFRQPDGKNIDFDIYIETMSAYEESDFKKNPELKGSFTARINAYYDFDSYKSHLSQIYDKKFYFDNKGVYSYKKQKTPIFYWKVKDVEKRYRILTKNIF